MNAGGVIHFAVSTTSPTYDLNVYRVGWYQGARGRLLLSATHLTGSNQGYWIPQTYGVQACPSCEVDPKTGYLDVHWGMSYTLQVPAGWVSGTYLARLSTPSGGYAYIIFVVRSDARTSAILAVMPVNTYQAYNVWGGKSLYPGYGPPTLSGSSMAIRVSFNRPYVDQLIYFGNRDHDLELIGFLEQHGYDVSYATSVDLDRDPTLLSRHRLYLSLGHDEYWTKQMRTNVELARDAGVSLTFLGGNDVYRQLRFDSDSQGQSRRALLQYRPRSLDPLALTDPSSVTDSFVDLHLPQNSLTGTIYDGKTPTPVPWVVAPGAPAWLLAGTGLVPGNTIPGLVAQECDGTANNGAQPASLQVVGSATFTIPAGPRVCDSTWYTTTHHSEVFNAADEGWGYAIDNTAVAQMTLNVLNRLSA